MSALDLTVIGDVNVDILTSPISSYPKKDSMISVKNIEMEVGGGSAHFAMVASKLGLKTRMIGMIGDDVFGHFILKDMEKFGIDSRIKTCKNANTGVSIGIHFKDGSRSLFEYSGTNELFSRKDFDLKNIVGRFLYLGGYNLTKKFQKDYLSTIEHARSKNMMIGLDLDLKGGINCNMKELGKIIGKVDIFFPDFLEAKLITSKNKEKEMIKKILGYGCKIVCLKLGHRGCMIGSKDDILFMPGMRIEPVNPTGTGDIFNAAFVFSYLKHLDMKKAGIFANVTAALSTTKFGNERFVNEKQVKRLISSI
jgi:sugar/nucleoside kinase (ribokinase family)